MDPVTDEKIAETLNRLCQSAVYYWPELNRQVPSSNRPSGAYLPGITICRQKGYVPPLGLTPKKQ